MSELPKPVAGKIVFESPGFWLRIDCLVVGFIGSDDDWLIGIFVLYCMHGD